MTARYSRIVQKVHFRHHHHAPQRRTPIEYDCDACGAYNIDSTHLARHQNKCQVVRTRARRAFEKSQQLQKKRLAEKMQAKAEKLACVAASHLMPTTWTLQDAGNSCGKQPYLCEGSMSTIHTVELSNLLILSVKVSNGVFAYEVVWT